MKVETPQILWNAEQGGVDNHGNSKTAINAALYSVSMVQSGIVDPTLAAAGASSQDANNSNNNISNNQGYSNVLATAGNSPLINLWKVSFPPLAAAAAESSKDRSVMYQRHERGNNNSNISNNKSPPTTKTTTTGNNVNNNINNNNNSHTKIDYLCTLARHDGAVNCLAFSPDGLHLATAGDKSSSVIVWSVPVTKRGNNNGRHYWSSVTREADLVLRILSCNCDGVVDVSWSADSKRFLIGTIDSAVLVVEDTNYAANHPTTPPTNNNGTSNNSPPPQQPQQLDSSWKVVYRSKEHTHFVQGVSYDPLGVYLASMSNDRSVRIYPRKIPGGAKSKKKVLRPSSSAGAKNKNNNNSISTTSTAPINSALPPANHALVVANLLTESKLDFGKSKQIKQRKIVTDAITGTIVKQSLFADESTLESFFRRLSWTTDGAFLVTPAVLWHSISPVSTAAAAATTTSTTTATTSTSPATAAGSGSGAPSYATCLYARHHFDQPYKVLSGLEKPSLVVRPNPVLFQLPETAVVEVATKENANAAASSLSPKNTAAPSASRSTSSPSAVSLPYKSIFCVLTNDSVLIYDTHHDVPLSVVRGLHYSNLADATWSQDGHSLIVCSTDGYLSILRFAPGELGNVYTPPPLPPVPIETAVTTTTTVSNTTPVAALGVSTNGGNVVSAANSSSRSNSTVPPTMMVRPKPKKSMALAATSNNIKPLPPCEPGSEAVLEEPPMKRSKTSHVNDVSGDSLSMTAQPLASSSCASKNKRPASVALGEEGNDDDHDETVKAVDKLSLGNDNADNNNTTNVAPVALAKKKKRVQPILLSSA